MGSPMWVGVDVFRGVLRQADEGLHVLEYRHVPLLKCMKLPLLELNEARREIVSPKSHMELIPRDLVPSGFYRQERSTPGPQGTMQTLRREASLLLLSEAGQ
ncbi:hypothetical protein U9M48_032148 [Paspalum notatum var. saurae]|uniref:Uncharacterized protein n=1 Tax=Paspalum notatum var. saurae TaxID=547442 RepID=A0AAQ3X454_PASNO